MRTEICHSSHTQKRNILGCKTHITNTRQDAKILICCKRFLCQSPKVCPVVPSVPPSEPPRSSLERKLGPVKARLKIDTERVIGDIDPKLYGNFIEHLGRCIEGGIFDERSPLADGDGFRKDVLDAARKLHVTQLRWPGGNFASNYHWKDGIGPRDGRPPRLEMAWGTVESNRFGTHEFMKYAEKLGAEPYFCVNLAPEPGKKRSNGSSTSTAKKTQP